ncbi:hypothetical protein KM043_010875 [Ampulex compressa]|nr:hypothetical protein KM043_010875 [Ampulex compressa]
MPDGVSMVRAAKRGGKCALNGFGKEKEEENSRKSTLHPATKKRSYVEASFSYSAKNPPVSRASDPKMIAEPQEARGFSRGDAEAYCKVRRHVYPGLEAEEKVEVAEEVEEDEDEEEEEEEEVERPAGASLEARIYTVGA